MLLTLKLKKVKGIRKVTKSKLNAHAHTHTHTHTQKQLHPVPLSEASRNPFSMAGMNCFGMFIPMVLS